MEFAKYCLENLDNIDYEKLSEDEKTIYLSIDKLFKYKIPKKNGKIVYNKENYAEYCKMFRNGIKDKSAEHISQEKWKDLYRICQD